jgi:hypothetical protein
MQTFDRLASGFGEVFEYLESLPNRSQDEPIPKYYADLFTKMFNNSIGKPSTDTQKIVLMKHIQDPKLALLNTKAFDKETADELCALCLIKNVSLIFCSAENRQYWMRYGPTTSRPVIDDTVEVEVGLDSSVCGACTYNSSRTYSGTLNIPLELLQEGDECEIRDYIISHRFELSVEETDTEYEDFNESDEDNFDLNVDIDGLIEEYGEDEDGTY